MFSRRQLTATPYFKATPANPHGVSIDRHPWAATSRTSNIQPYLCVDFIISLFGIFPSQT